MKLVILSTMVIPEVSEPQLQAVEAAARDAGLEVVVGTRESQLTAIEDADIAFGASPQRGNRIVERYRRNLTHFQAGEPLEGVIDNRKGY